MIINNYITAIILSFFYFLSLFLREYSLIYFFVGMPILFVILGYNLINGKAIIKRIFTGLIPVLALAWIFLFLELENFVGIFVWHLTLMSIFVGFYEVIEDVIQLLIKLLKKIKKKIKGMLLR